MIGLIARYSTGREIVRESATPRGLKLPMPDGRPIEIVISKDAEPYQKEMAYRAVDVRNGTVMEVA